MNTREPEYSYIRILRRSACGYAGQPRRSVQPKGLEPCRTRLPGRALMIEQIVAALAALPTDSPLLPTIAEGL